MTLPKLNIVIYIFFSPYALGFHSMNKDTGSRSSCLNVSFYVFYYGSNLWGTM